LIWVGLRLRSCLVFVCSCLITFGLLFVAVASVWFAVAFVRFPLVVAFLPVCSGWVTFAFAFIHSFCVVQFVAFHVVLVRSRFPFVRVYVRLVRGFVPAPFRCGWFTGFRFWFFVLRLFVDFCRLVRSFWFFSSFVRLPFGSRSCRRVFVPGSLLYGSFGYGSFRCGLLILVTRYVSFAAFCVSCVRLFRCLRLPFRFLLRCVSRLRYAVRWFCSGCVRCGFVCSAFAGCVCLPGLLVTP